MKTHKLEKKENKLIDRETGLLKKKSIITREI